MKISTEWEKNRQITAIITQKKGRQTILISLIMPSREEEALTLFSKVLRRLSTAMPDRSFTATVLSFKTSGWTLFQHYLSVQQRLRE